MMNTTKKRQRRGKDVLKCFHCGGYMGVCQEDLWWLVIETDDKILLCDRCVDEYNATLASTGKVPRLSINYAPNGLIELLAMEHGVEEIPW